MQNAIKKDTIKVQVGLPYKAVRTGSIYAPGIFGIFKVGNPLQVACSNESF
jgi:hypothetical protein